ncbi:MAG TPA: response regulator transcription factor [Roseiarcus sp.]
MSDHLSSCLLNEDEPRPGGGGVILLIEDDGELAEEIRLDLETSGRAVQVAPTLSEGLQAARLGEAAVLVVDRILDGQNGLSVIEALRSEGKWTPVLAISELTSVDERIAGLKAGCDDYLVKPFDVRELTARVEALLRRGGDMGVVRLRVGDLEMDLIDRTVRYEGRLVDLVPREFKLLEYFMRRPGQTITRAMLLEDVWSFQPPAYTNIVDVQIGNLRRKLNPTDNRRVIVSVRSVGFKLNMDH